MNTRAAHKHMQVVLLHHMKNVRESVLNITHCYITNVRHKQSFSFPSSVSLVSLSKLSTMAMLYFHLTCYQLPLVLAHSYPFPLLYHKGCFGSYYTYYTWKLLYLLRIYPNRGPGLYFLRDILYPASKQSRPLFGARPLFL